MENYKKYLKLLEKYKLFIKIIYDIIGAFWYLGVVIGID